MAYTTIDDPSAYFQTTLYTGNGGTNAITNTGNSDLQPDWVWLKDRTTSEASHKVYDAVRGTTKYLAPNNTGAEATESGVTAFGSDGFTLGSAGGTNGNGISFVSWNWKESATAGFDIVAYTGTGSSNAVSHSLSATPSMIIIKNRDDADSWYVWHQGLGAVASNYINLDTSGPKSSVSDGITAISSSNFTVNTRGDVNASSEKYIAYCFAEKQGYSKFGTYEGNGNANGTYVHLGFQPAFLIVKPIDAADNWVMFDNKRLGFNSSTSPYNFYANTNGPETTDTGQLDFVSNGFKIRNGGGTVNKTSTYIYMAFASNPFTTSTGVPATAR